MRRLLPLLVITWCVSCASVSAQEHAGSPEDAEPTAAAGHDEAAGDSHAGEQGHGPKYELLTIDGMTALWTIIVFVVLLVVLRATAWKPIQKVLADREKFIADSLEQAKREREEADALLAKYVEQIKAAREEASGIVEEGRRDADVVRRKIEEDAREEAGAILERAKREIGIATDTAVKELYEMTGKLATDVASRIIRKELSAQDHERLIAESIREFEALAVGGGSES